MTAHEAAPTASEMRDALLRKLRGGKHDAFAAGAIARAPRTGPVPASSAQERLWFLDELYGANAAYNVAFAVRLDGPLRLDVLRESLDRLVARHEALRTRYTKRGERLFQVIAPVLTLDVPCVDLSGFDEAGAEAEVRGRLAAESRVPFSLTTEPLVRARVYRTSATRHHLFVNFHHSITDGWSEGIFFRELWTLYEAGGRRPGTHACPTCPCSTPTTRCGSTARAPPPTSNARSATGRTGWAGTCPSWTCPPTGRGPPSPASAAPRSPWTCPRTSRGNWTS
ncbi:hypothetical protein GCM10020254_08310 [Streptomyces goshikiensis]